MFYYYVGLLLRYNFILIAAAVIPAAFLLVRVYQLDRLEKESPRLLWSLVKAGIFSSLIALVLEKVFISLLNSYVPRDSEWFRILLYFVIVGISEEGAKYFMLRRTSWNTPEFNCLYDGIVYAVFVSLGFALWENISYVLHYGFANAVIRAITAIPGHASFGVFMGLFYSASKMFEIQGDTQRSNLYSFIAILIPVLIHGAYDYIATLQTDSANVYFIAFIAVLFIVSIRLIKEFSQKDRYIV
jgi:RsiW-degrading membrane proteinase PrsW (M82 family)